MNPQQWSELSGEQQNLFIARCNYPLLMSTVASALPMLSSLFYGRTKDELTQDFCKTMIAWLNLGKDLVVKFANKTYKVDDILKVIPELKEIKQKEAPDSSKEEREAMAKEYEQQQKLDQSPDSIREIFNQPFTYAPKVHQDEIGARRFDGSKRLDEHQGKLNEKANRSEKA